MPKFLHICAALAALLGAAGVGEAATAAHAIANPLLRTSSEFLLFHAAAIVAFCAFGLTGHSSRWLAVGIGILLFGTIVFCGELTSHVLFGSSALAILAPIGGSLTILGWLIAALGISVGARASDDN